ncbi:hypothetical protein L7F22_008735 [Adiantum nelumboides]|nr:hypothetical protein [Adiantum nelumboides]
MPLDINSLRLLCFRYDTTLAQVHLSDRTIDNILTIPSITKVKVSDVSTTQHIYGTRLNVERPQELDVEERSTVFNEREISLALDQANNEILLFLGPNFDVSRFIWENILYFGFGPQEIAILQSSFREFMDQIINLGLWVVLYLKWGSLVGAYFQCNKLGHFLRNYPSISQASGDVIPSYPRSKNIVPREKIFGKSPTVIHPNSKPTQSVPANVTSLTYAQPLGVVANKNVSRPLFHVGSLAIGPSRRNNQGSTSSTSNGGGKMSNKGKRLIDVEAFQSVSARKSFKPRQVYSSYASPNVFDVLQDIPSPDTLNAVEEACHTAEKNKSPRDTPAISIEMNMDDSDEGYLEANNTQIVLNTPR